MSDQDLGTSPTLLNCHFTHTFCITKHVILSFYCSGSAGWMVSWVRISVCNFGVKCVGILRFKWQQMIKCFGEYFLVLNHCKLLNRITTLKKIKIEMLMFTFFNDFLFKHYFISNVTLWWLVLISNLDIVLFFKRKLTILDFEYTRDVYSTNVS